jgi:hypothetical protein
MLRIKCLHETLQNKTPEYAPAPTSLSHYHSSLDLRVPGSYHVALRLFGIDMPDDIVWQTIDTVSSTFGHLREAFGLGLILEWIAGEVDARAVYVCFDNDVDAADAVERNFFVLVGVPVAHEGHVFAVGGELLVAFCEDDVLG